MDYIWKSDFEKLPENIMIKILDECDYRTIKNLILVNNNFKSFIRSTYKNDFENKKFEHKKNKLSLQGFPFQLLKIFPKDVILKCKLLNLPDADNNVIENLHISHFVKSQYRYGWDTYNRFFFSVILITSIDSKLIFKPLTIYQSYIDDKNIFNSCSTALKDFNIKETFNINYLQNNEFIHTYLELLNNKFLINNKLSYIDERNNTTMYIDKLCYEIYEKI